VVVMCHVLDVKSNNFYSFKKRKVSTVDDPTHQEMVALIKDIAKFSDNTYGARRIKKHSIH
jgi:putative transposase